MPASTVPICWCPVANERVHDTAPSTRPKPDQHDGRPGDLAADHRGDAGALQEHDRSVWQCLAFGAARWPGRLGTARRADRTAGSRLRHFRRRYVAQPSGDQCRRQADRLALQARVEPGRPMRRAAVGRCCGQRRTCAWLVPAAAEALQQCNGRDLDRCRVATRRGRSRLLRAQPERRQRICQR